MQFVTMRRKINMMKQYIRRLMQQILPAARAEYAVLLAVFAVYGIFAGYIALHYRIVFDDRIPWDAYFSFDNRSIVMTGGGFERHPLSNYFFDALRSFALTISEGRKDEVFRLVLALCSALAVSFSVLYVFKYMRNIIGLPLWNSVLLTVFFGCSSTALLLSFTPETYTYSLLLLTFFNYHFGQKLRNEQKIHAVALVLATVTVGGLTVTNAVKAALPVFFEKKLWRSGRNMIHAAARLVLAAGVFILLYLYRLQFDWQRIFAKTGEQYEKFSKPKSTPLWDMIFSWFFGGNMLFPSFVIRDYHSVSGFRYKALFMDVYSAAVPYIFVAVLLGLMLWALVKNRGNRLVWVLFLSFMTDFIIHSVLKFGLHTSYIYGGHFVFIYPMMMAWLLFSYIDKPKILAMLSALMLLMLLYLMLNNLYRLTEFFEFLNCYYQ